jgi:eukaryotic-like serine/threonine-protein kinase
MTSPAVTDVGVLIGTAAYMAPEQVRGRTIDQRVDIWAFGCVLYEMLTGARAFGGAEVTETLGLVVTTEPDWTKLPPTTPASLQRLLNRCLDKDRRRRLAHIADARFDLDETAASPLPQPRQGSMADAMAFALWQFGVPEFQPTGGPVVAGPSAR